MRWALMAGCIVTRLLRLTWLAVTGLVRLLWLFGVIRLAVPWLTRLPRLLIRCASRYGVNSWCGRKLSRYL